MPTAIAIVADQYRTRRARAVGLFTSVAPIGAILGPNLGGYILEHAAVSTQEEAPGMVLLHRCGVAARRKRLGGVLIGKPRRIA
jgi:MFS family permease